MIYVVRYFFLRQRHLPAVCSEGLFSIRSIQQRQKTKNGRLKNIDLKSTKIANNFYNWNRFHLHWFCHFCWVCPIIWGRDVVAAALALFFAAPQARADVGEGLVRICVLSPWQFDDDRRHASSGRQTRRSNPERPWGLQQLVTSCNNSQRSVVKDVVQLFFLIILTILTLLPGLEQIAWETDIGRQRQGRWNAHARSETFTKTTSHAGFSRQEKFPWDFLVVMTQEWDNPIGFLRPGPTRHSHIHSNSIPNSEISDAIMECLEANLWAQWRYEVSYSRTMQRHEVVHRLFIVVLWFSMICKHLANILQPVETRN